MKNWLSKKIKNKLHNYKTVINIVNTELPLHPSSKKKVAVIGAGIAGLSATANLAERGFEVTLFEKNKYIGGKVGSWQFESNNETLRTEHGFHAFFRQYYNLRNFMKKIGIYQHLIPIDDYIIYYQDGKQQGFKGIDNTPALNIFDLRKKGILSNWTFLNPKSANYLDLLKYHPEKTFEKFDHISFEEYANKTAMPSHLRLVFTSFARAFFAEPDKISMAELIKGFHFYFLSSDDGLIYDVLNDDFENTFLQPIEKFIVEHNGKIKRNSCIEKLNYTGNKFEIDNELFDYCILSLDAKHIKPLVQKSTGFEKYNTFNEQINMLKCTDSYAVWRIWTDSFEMNKDLPFFIFTDRLKCLDSVTFYHKMEKESEQWSTKNNGGIFELHSYSLPDGLTDENEIKEQLLQEFFHYFPELKNLKIKHQYFQHRDDFPAFHLHQYKNRPTVNTEVPNLFLAGDWVKLPAPAMLMEAAYTSGAMAANCILSNENLRENELISVSNYGLFA
ncbi:MAG: FAD-dependent oxidoreductase [Chitinophagales bacterium]